MGGGQRADVTEGRGGGWLEEQKEPLRDEEISLDGGHSGVQSERPYWLLRLLSTIFLEYLPVCIFKVRTVLKPFHPDDPS